MYICICIYIYIYIQIVEARTLKSRCYSDCMFSDIGILGILRAYVHVYMYIYIYIYIYIDIDV